MPADAPVTSAVPSEDVAISGDLSWSVGNRRFGACGTSRFLPRRIIGYVRRSPFHWTERFMDRLEAMTTLLAVVDTGSLSAASRRLHTPLTTVSRRISELEAHLRTRLLNRTTRRVTLTDAGGAYVAACRRIVEQIDEAERVAGGEYQAPRGELTLTAPMVFGRVHVVPVVAGFMEAYPDIRLNLRLSDRVLDLQEEHVDVAVRIGELPDSAMLARK